MTQGAGIIKRPLAIALLKEPEQKLMQEIKVSDPRAEHASARPDPLVGTTLMGRYRIDALIASGGMGRVYRGEHLALQQKVAIKVLHSHLLASPQAAERFFKEAKAASQLRHPAIAAVSDFGESESGEPYIVMDYIAGQPLSQKLEATGTLSADESMAIATSVLNALSCCHSQGIIHRDLKPSNIILADHTDDLFAAKLVDFGIAKLAREEGEAGRVTATGEIFGSPYYMSPEQCQSNQIDGRSDIYALGCVLYECLCGEPPFSGRNLIEILMRQCSEAAPPLAQRAPQCPKYLADIVHAMLEKSPKDRPATAEQVLSMLQTGEKHSGKQAPVLIKKAKTTKSSNATSGNTANKWDSIVRLAGKQPKQFILAGLGLILLTGTSCWLSLGLDKPKSHELDVIVRQTPTPEQIDEIDVLIERAETERMNGQFFESRQSYQMANEKCQYLNTAPPHAVNDRAALIKVGEALDNLEVKDLADLHVSPVFGAVKALPEQTQRLESAKVALTQAVNYADNARTAIAQVDSDNTVPKLAQKLRTTARIYLAAVQFLQNDFAEANETCKSASDLLRNQSLILNNCESDLLKEVDAELLWQNHKYLEAARIYSQSPKITDADAYGEPDNKFGGNYLSANHDYKLSLPLSKATPEKFVRTSGTWQNLTLAAPNNKSTAVPVVYNDKYMTLILMEPGVQINTQTPFIGFHIGKSLLLKMHPMHDPSINSVPHDQVIIMHNVKS